MNNLNKNQKKFITYALNHFGDESDNIRLKDLNSFAKDNDLILPTSFLKNHCRKNQQTRGYYDLTLAGIKPKIKSKVEESLLEFKSSENVILDTSAFIK